MLLDFFTYFSNVTALLASAAIHKLAQPRSHDREMKGLHMASPRVSPAKVARVVERARHHLNRLHQRMAPPHAAMMDLIMGAWTAQAITAAADLGRCRRGREGSAIGR